VVPLRAKRRRDVAVLIGRARRRGFHRVQMRHGVSPLRSGHAMRSDYFHDAR